MKILTEHGLTIEGVGCFGLYFDSPEMIDELIKELEDMKEHGNHRLWGFPQGCTADQMRERLGVNDGPYDKEMYPERFEK